MKIKVTQEHIEKGQPNRSEWCPIALALKETFPQDNVVVVGTSVAMIIRELSYTDFPLPIPVRQFIKDFDANSPVAPFEFELVAAR